MTQLRRDEEPIAVAGLNTIGGAVSDPNDEELRAFVSAMLSNLDKLLREPEVIEDAIAKHREMWVALYHAGAGLHVPG